MKKQEMPRKEETESAEEERQKCRGRKRQAVWRKKETGSTKEEKDRQEETRNPEEGRDRTVLRLTG